MVVMEDNPTSSLLEGKVVGMLFIMATHQEIVRRRIETVVVPLQLKTTTQGFVTLPDTGEAFKQVYIDRQNLLHQNSPSSHSKSVSPLLPKIPSIDSTVSGKNGGAMNRTPSASSPTDMYQSL
ncbi:hypothetical protein L195_g003112 [Trifolium pratense]|uniref:Uncharacterized protein n=1 Tax=Trifolium pratense TaxID=57577 RepID=A0A2K3NUC8_TRIPR|nr:hypothetical protein L195_g003112 [Trifolium pratense]